jgi:hypothetical protein
MIERWLAEITQKRIRRGFKSVPELVAAITEYIKVNNAGLILAKLVASAG